MEDYIPKRVHELYWEQDINCARTTLTVLGELLHIELAPQVIQSAVGLHGAGGFRAQCGLVEGALMTIGIYFTGIGKNAGEVSAICYRFADAFTKKFSSLACRELRPGGFTQNDPPHACENLTGRAIAFAYDFIKSEEATILFRG